MTDGPSPRLGWIGIFRLGLVQAALGSIVVLAVTTLNRVMVVELALPAIVPGGLVALHYAVQIVRPRWGHGSDGARRRTPWIMGGMALLALGGAGAALAVAAMRASFLPGLALAALSYLMIGGGVGAAGTSLLTLAATRVAPARRAAASSILWIMMIMGFAVTAGAAGSLLDPFSPTRLVAVVATVCGLAVLVSGVALLGVEGAAVGGTGVEAPVGFKAALRQVCAEPAVWRFTLFVFTAMLAYGAQDLVIDPFAGRVLGLTPGETTRLSGLQHGGALLGMLTVAFVGALWGGRHPGLLRRCAVAGCLGSAAVLVALALAGAAGSGFPLRSAVATLGFCNGVFAVSVIGAMMSLAGEGGGRQAGIRMGLWGAAQALAFGFGCIAAPASVDLGTALSGSPAVAYGTVFLALALLFCLSARLAATLAVAGRAGAEVDGPFRVVSA